VARERKISVAIVTRRLSTLSSFYKWVLEYEIVEADPVYLADQPKRPWRIPVWLEKEEQQRLEATLKDRRNIPTSIFGNNIPRMTGTRHQWPCRCAQI
jgi:integrase/recombinase XerD